MIKKFSPILITLFWAIGVLITGLISGIIADSSAPGGEQKLFTYIAYSIIVTLVGVFLINVAALFWYRVMDKRVRIVSLCLIIISLIFLYPIVKGFFLSRYDTLTQTVYAGNDEIYIQKECYPTKDTTRLIRSESFWKNGKKDSVWAIYEKDGSVIKQVRYHNDAIVETISPK